MSAVYPVTRWPRLPHRHRPPQQPPRGPGAATRRRPAGDAPPPRQPSRRPRGDRGLPAGSAVGLHNPPADRDLRGRRPTSWVAVAQWAGSGL